MRAKRTISARELQRSTRYFIKQKRGKNRGVFLVFLFHYIFGVFLDAESICISSL